MTHAPLPDPVRQAPGSWDCALASAAWICRLFGFGDGIEDVRRALAAGIDVEGVRRHVVPDHYPRVVRAIPARMLPWDQGEEPWRLGLGAEGWVRRHLDGGEVAFVNVHRGGPSMHAVVLVDADDAGVVLMDPALGFVREP